ncbi:MAG: biotin/lipoyl-binding protein, partial [Rugosibacter sp.]
MRNLIKKTDAPAVLVHDDTLPLIVKTDHAHFSRIGWIIVLLGFGGFLIWAFFAPLDKGVPVQGTVMVSSNRKAIQHPTGGRVEDILVKEGDVVKAGQVLVKMNDVAVRAAAASSRAQYFTDRAVEARLIAERDGKPKVSFADELTEAAKADPSIGGNISLQQLLFSSRQSALKSELAGIDQGIAGLKIQTEGLQNSLASKQEQLVFLKEQLAGMRDLAKDGYVARNRLLELERTYAQLN